MRVDLLITGGRVIDPETGLDAIADVAVTDGRIVAIDADAGDTAPVAAGRRLDATGCVVAPGFIDLHSHAQTIPSLRVQALDGVTTALDLEAGAGDVPVALAAARAEGRPIHHGFSAGWAMTRNAVLTGAPVARSFLDGAHDLGATAWQADLDRRQHDWMLGHLGEQLAAGAIGIGILVGYGPGTPTSEYADLSELAAEAGLPTFTHARGKNPAPPLAVVDAVDELITAAEQTGAHTHLCHMNSTSLHTVDRVTERISLARQRSLPVTTEAYPYGAGMTAIGAPFLHPDRLAKVGAVPSQVVVVRTGERPADAGRLLELRAEDPGALVIIHYLDEAVPAERALVERAVFFEDTAIASDAIPFLLPDGSAVEGDRLVPAGARSHPRTAGTFAKFLRLARETGQLGLVDAVRRCSLLPAQILAQAVPAMAAKGRVQVGCDADLVVFDADRVTDRATYAEPSLTSSGFRHVVVAGVSVVADGILTDALPGRAVVGKGT